MVKLVSLLLNGLVVADNIAEVEDFAMLQSSSASKKISGLARSKNISAWREPDQACVYIDRPTLCPISEMQKLEADYNTEEDSLDAKIGTLEADIAEQQKLTAEVVLRTDGILANINARIVAALSKTANARADIIIIGDKVKSMKTDFGIAYTKVQDTLDAVEETVGNVLHNSLSVAEFLTEAGEQPSDTSDTGLLQEGRGRWFFGRSWTVNIWALVVKVFPNVADATENILKNDDEVYQYKVDNARADFTEKAEALEQTISVLESALEDEERELTSALTAVPEAKADLVAASAERKLATTALFAVRAGQRELRSLQLDSMAKLKAEIGLLKKWIEVFQTRFSGTLFRALSQKL